MKMTRKSLILLAVVLFSTPALSGQDLSKYRNFSLGTTLAGISKQIGPGADKASLIYQRPAVIQQMTYWSAGSFRPDRPDPVSQILFSFYNGELYRIEVTYDRNATAGMTPEDMVQALSAQYGIAITPASEMNSPADRAYGSEAPVIARWEDSQNTIKLLHSSTLDSFSLALLSKRLTALAETAILESVRLEKEEAPQKEIERQKMEADNLELTRQTNKKSFRP
jgi:hypothetical protein